MHGLRDALEQSQKDGVAIGHFNVGDWVDGAGWMLRAIVHRLTLEFLRQIGIRTMIDTGRNVLGRRLEEGKALRSILRDTEIAQRLPVGTTDEER